MRPNRQAITDFATAVVVACLITVAWVLGGVSIQDQREQISARVTAMLFQQAQLFAGQVHQQLLTADQTVRILADVWAADPARFDLMAWRDRALALEGLGRELILTDETGRILQSTVTEAVGQSLASSEAFQTLSRRGPGRPARFVGPATVDRFLRLWHLDIARPLFRPGGGFAGMILTEYRTSAITAIFAQADLGPGGLVALVGLMDGRVRAAAGPASIDPAASIAGTPLFAALGGEPDSVWVGPSVPEATPRIHVYQRIPDFDLAVVAGARESDVMGGAIIWENRTILGLVGITVLLVTMTAMVLIRSHRLRRREAAQLALREEQTSSHRLLELARAEAAAKSEQLHAALGGMSDGIAMVNGDLRLLEWNARFPELVGVPADMLRVGVTMDEILRAQAIGGEFGDVNVEAEVRRRIAMLRSGYIRNAERRRPNGRTIELRRDRLSDGGFITIYSDITEHKEAENQLREARAAAEAANATKSRFVAIVSHEIRTPLNALLNTLRLLADSSLSTAQRSLLDMARQSGDALSGLINDVLEMSRLEAGQLTLRPSRFALRPLLASATGVFGAQARERGITFRVTADNDVPLEIVTDPGRIRQILLNLLSNAVKFAIPGDVEVRAETLSNSEGRLLRVLVRDQGPVIPVEHRGRLFQPFSRLDHVGDEDPIGTGLGLAICRHLVTLMGGEIGVEIHERDNGPAGNQFWFQLPLVEVQPVQPLGLVTMAANDRGPSAPGPEPKREPESGIDTFWDVPAAAMPASLPRTRILLVEDVRANQIVTATMLRRQGHMVDVVANGDAAIHAARTTPYDIVFMDIFMPGMSGYEAAHHIRALRPPAGQVPIIALTANISDGDGLLFRSAGMDGNLGKPVDLAALLDTMGRHVWHTGAVPTPQEEFVPEQSLAAASPAPAIPLPLLSPDRIDELRRNLPAETLTDLVEECLTDLELRLPALRRSLAAGSGPAIVAQAHAMVGVAAGYGMSALERRLRTIMNTVRDDAANPQEGAAKEVEAELARAAEALREELKKDANFGRPLTHS